MKKISLVAFVVSLAGCITADQGGAPLGYVAAEPPVATNTPSGLKLSALVVGTNKPRAITDQDILSLKQTVFLQSYGRMGVHDCEGVVRCALKNIDARMQELDVRNQESERACLGGTPYPQSLNIPVGATTETYSHKLQCADQLSVPSGFVGEQWLAFGLEGDRFYLDFQQSAGVMYLATVNTSTKDVEAWVIEDGASPYHLTSYESSGILELTADYRCGLHMRNNKDLVYIELIPEVSGVCVGDTAPQVWCLSAADLSTQDPTLCQQAQLETFELTSIRSVELDRATLQNLAQDLSVIKSLPVF